MLKFSIFLRNFHSSHSGCEGLTHFAWGGDFLAKLLLSSGKLLDYNVSCKLCMHTHTLEVELYPTMFSYISMYIFTFIMAHGWARNIIIEAHTFTFSTFFLLSDTALYRSVYEQFIFCIASALHDACLYCILAYFWVN